MTAAPDHGLAAARADHRKDRRWYTPSGLPSAAATYAAEGSAASRAGKVGLLELDLVPAAGTTRLVRHFQRTPLHLFRPIYLDPARPDMAFLHLLQGGEGLVGGDRYRIDVVAHPGAAVHVATQSATKIFRMPIDLATQLVNVTAGPGAVVEYLPEPVIPFAGSRFFGRTRLVVDPEATVITAETLLPGRVASGEAHAYDFYWAETVGLRPDGRELFTDTLHLTPDAARRPAPAQLGAFDVHATVHVLSQIAEPRTLVGLLHDALAGCTGVLAGVTELPREAGVTVRIVGPDSAAVGAAVRIAWSVARWYLLGAPVPDLRMR